MLSKTLALAVTLLLTTATIAIAAETAPAATPAPAAAKAETKPAEAAKTTEAAKPAEEKKADEKPAATTTEAKPTFDTNNPLFSERSIGKADAPITMIEYFSLTCSHCADFTTQTLPAIKAKYIDSGKLRVIFRDFPLDPYAKQAAMMARCAPKDNYYDVIETIFGSQERWIKAADPQDFLVKIGSLVGINEQQFKTCVANADLDKFILTGMQEAQGKYSLTAVPTLIFNEGKKTLTGYQTASQMEKALEELGVKAETPKKEEKK